MDSFGYLGKPTINADQKVRLLHRGNLHAVLESAAVIGASDHVIGQ